MQWHERGGLRFLETELGGARVAFSTRLGGVSGAPFASLNLGAVEGERSDLVLENRRRLAAGLDLDPARILLAHQVHGSNLRLGHGHASGSPFTELGAPLPDADGLISAKPGGAALVFVADCLPIALRGEGGVAMLHCGWRGLAAGIVARGAAAVRAEAAAVGPGIGPCCYEVGDEVRAAFGGLGEGFSSGRALDLRAIAVRLLRDAGVREVEVTELCTSCEVELFFSHRRDAGRSGRQVGVAWIEGD